MWCFGATYDEGKARSQVTLVVFDPVIDAVISLPLSKGMNLTIVQPTSEQCEFFKRGYEKFKLSASTLPATSPSKPKRILPRRSGFRPGKKTRRSSSDEVIAIDDADDSDAPKSDAPKRKLRARPAREVSVGNGSVEGVNG